MRISIRDLSKHTKVDIFYIILSNINTENDHDINLLYEIIYNSCIDCKRKILDSWNLKYDRISDNNKLRNIIDYLKKEKTFLIRYDKYNKISFYHCSKNRLLIDYNLCDQYDNNKLVLSHSDYLYNLIDKKISSDQEDEIYEGFCLLKYNYFILKNYMHKLIDKSKIILDRNDIILDGNNIMDSDKLLDKVNLKEKNKVIEKSKLFDMAKTEDLMDNLKTEDLMEKNKLSDDRSSLNINVIDKKIKNKDYLIKIEILKVYNQLVITDNINIFSILKYMIKYLKSESHLVLIQIFKFWRIIIDKNINIFNTNYNYIIKCILEIFKKPVKRNLIDFICKLLEKVSKIKKLITVYDKYIQSGLKDKSEYQNIICIDLLRSVLQDNQFEFLSTNNSLIFCKLKDKRYQKIILKYIIKLLENNFETIMPYLDDIIKYCITSIQIEQEIFYKKSNKCKVKKKINLKKDEIELSSFNSKNKGNLHKKTYKHGLIIMRSILENIKLINTGKELQNVNSEAYEMYILQNKKYIEEYLKLLNIHIDIYKDLYILTKKFDTFKIIIEILKYSDFKIEMDEFKELFKLIIDPCVQEKYLKVLPK